MFTNDARKCYINISQLLQIHCLFMYIARNMLHYGHTLLYVLSVLHICVLRLLLLPQRLKTGNRGPLLEPDLGGELAGECVVAGP